MLSSLIDIRRYLHQNPELSEKEVNTARFIENQFASFRVDFIVKVGNSRIFVFDSGKDGPSIAFRADMDALPIQEKNTIDHVSKTKGVSHVCGHDGHMAILIGLGQGISKNPPKKGKVVLVFQSAEETGKGAKQIVASEEFQKLNIDYIFGLHNIPGFKLGQVLIREGAFASASKGMIVKLDGKTSHAAEPEKGINPALAMAHITQELHQLIQRKDFFSNTTLLTFIYSNLGEKAFGTSAGHAELGFTLRAFENTDMELLVEEVSGIISRIAKEHHLQSSFIFTEEFPGTVSSKEAYTIIKNAAKQIGLEVLKLDKPMRWSEDFGYYSKVAKTGFFGLGSGIHQPQLHHPDFDFPDELIDGGVSIFLEIYNSFY